MGPSWGHLGAILGPFWGLLVPSWLNLGPPAGQNAFLQQRITTPPFRSTVPGQAECAKRLNKHPCLLDPPLKDIRNDSHFHLARVGVVTVHETFPVVGIERPFVTPWQFAMFASRRTHQVPTMCEGVLQQLHMLFIWHVLDKSGLPLHVWPYFLARLRWSARAQIIIFQPKWR